MRRAAVALGVLVSLAGSASAQRAADVPTQRAADVPAQRAEDAPAQPAADAVVETATPDAEAAGGIVVLDTDRLFAESLYGQRFAADLQARTEALIEENRRIEAELTAEEQELTRRRPEMTPQAFRAEADAFDAKVQQIRRERDAKERALQMEASSGRESFLAAAGPALGQVMLARGAAVILDRRAVFLSTGAVDITDAAIASVDAAIGEGESPDAAAPEEAAPEAADR